MRMLACTEIKFCHDNLQTMSEPTVLPFSVDRAKTGRAACKGCKEKCTQGELRIAKIVRSPYGDNQLMKSWYHVDCFMDALLKQRPTTKRVDSVDDINDWSALTKEDQEFIIKKLNKMENEYATKSGGKYTAKLITNTPKKTEKLGYTESSSEFSNTSTSLPVGSEEDNKFKVFTQLCNKISQVDAYTEKTSVINNFFTKGINGSGFKGDLILWCKLLLPQVSKRVYNLKSKQLTKLFSKIFNTDQDVMLTHLEQGDVAKTIEYFFFKCRKIKPAQESSLTIHDVEHFLKNLSKLTREEEQIYQFKKIINDCTGDDIRMIIRLIKGDLRINAGPKHILDGVHPDAYRIFQTSRNIDMVIEKVLPNNKTVKHKDSIQKTIKAQLQLMTPVLPMLAEACKSVAMAFKKCPNGMFSEIKYDGERVQVHKKGLEFKYFSRALKPVMPHKVAHFKDYLPKAFPFGKDLILDAEVLMVDVKTSKPLPFGTLGIHKQTEFKDAQVCLFVFDCLYYNGKVLLDEPIKKRREILHEHMKEIPNHVMFSEQKLIKKQEDLAHMIAEVLQLGLEGLVLKDLESTYEPGKRHWLKVKKDYLFDGAMADTADLVVLGAWFGSGKKGGMMSVFLMGCRDTRRNCWVTVTKVHTGHDDSTLDRLQKELAPLMVKISQEYTRVPMWLDCNRGMVPDFVADDPQKMPVWEITGTEFTKANIHTANGISVRFPRVTRIRSDKNWKTATNLDELTHLFKTSKEKTDVTLLNQIAETSSKTDTSLNKTPEKKNKLKEELDSPKNKKIKKEHDAGDTSVEKSPKRKNKIKPLKMKPIKRKNEEIMIKSGKRDNTPEDSSISSKDMFKSKSKNYEPPHKKNRNSPVNSKNPKKTLDSYFSSLKSNPEPGSEDLNTTGSSKKMDAEPLDDTIQDIQETEHQLMPKNPLPDTFKDIKVGFYPDFITFSEEDRRFFERHWIAYGGILVKSLKAKNIDFMVHSSNKIPYKKMIKLKERLSDNVAHVTKDWLRNSVNRLKLCDTKKYAVTVLP